MHLHLIALLLPEPLSSAVWALKQEVHHRTGSRNALRLPPHITLMPPLRQSAAFTAEVEALLAAFSARHTACVLQLEDFAWFQSRTLYVRVLQDTALQQLHADLYEQFRLQLPAVPQAARPFVPHVTLATRDLPPELVPRLHEDFARRRYRAEGLLQELTLFRHDGRVWQEISRFALLPLK